MNLEIKRTYLSECTPGIITYGEFIAYSLELPDLNNQRDISCIPAGLYECEKHHSPSNGYCIAIKNVVGRTHVQIHIANYLSGILGCVAIGDSSRIRTGGELWVTNSTKTMGRLMKVLPHKFLLEIK